MKQQIFDIEKLNIDNKTIPEFIALHIHFDGIRTYKNNDNNALYILFSALLMDKHTEKENTYSIGIKYNLTDEELDNITKNASNCEILKNNSLLYTDINYINKIDVITPFIHSKTDDSTIYKLFCKGEESLMEVYFNYYHFAMIQDICNTIYDSQNDDFNSLNLIDYSIFYSHIANRNAPVIILRSDLEYEIKYASINSLKNKKYKISLVININSGDDKIGLVLNLLIPVNKKYKSMIINGIAEKGIKIIDINDIAKYIVENTDRKYYVADESDIIFSMYMNKSTSKIYNIKNIINIKLLEGVCENCYIEIDYDKMEEIYNIISDL